MLVCPNCKRSTPNHEPAARGIFINMRTRKRVWVKSKGSRGQVLRDKFMAHCEDCKHDWWVIRDRVGQWHTVSVVSTT